MLAITHRTIPKSYGGPTSGGSQIQSTMKMSYLNPGDKAKLTPYDPNALRNRNKVVFDGAAKEGVRFCYPRNVTTFNFLEGPKEAGYQTYRTTSKNYYEYDTKPMPGESNQGIVSYRSKIIHQKQTL